MTMKIWKTKDGKEIKVSDMETSHIENCIKFMQKKLDTGDTIRMYGGGDSADDVWCDEDDISDEIEEWIDVFKLEILWRERN